ncbi:hypothetical protein A3D78_06170 [Candidatus Gottesmanbacteria bacterium RIFCSPHIGHO2_02_FULL_39_14]|uniref:Uncharacterized protein n=1 Tax=Candidatus Gottesmanbacteria bacterium RIFCSPHIGHO2_02_FULL_39_14 TaxID=1798383 RepID=A0A1F6A4Y2_9BACT|nr:MAG: hypothetical protein A3D78_06170 [Candidatus Gottesmanbacteria bacterium RIFCSPHIGHO2_02_FULL_39_14]
MNTEETQAARDLVTPVQRGELPKEALQLQGQKAGERIRNLIYQSSLATEEFWSPANLIELLELAEVDQNGHLISQINDHIKKTPDEPVGDNIKNLLIHFKY